ncbi:hypothetical protein EDB87DRAFT_756831 [Lactarius vividus]|nr:hypothetical protein EDB87DRAFT_756831 [Lactarius vividus]
MTDYTLPLDAHGDNRLVFLEHAWNIGRAQALELVPISQLLSQIAPPELAHEDPELRRILRVCDLALRSAASSGTKLIDEVNARVKEAIRVLSTSSSNSHAASLSLQFFICSRLEITRQRVRVERYRSHVKYESECGSSITIDFVVVRSPRLSPHNPETVIVGQGLIADPPFPEILWNLGQCKDHPRIILGQNPRFNPRCHVDESAYTPKFRRGLLQDLSGAL